jgi:hypothetical protein
MDRPERQTDGQNSQSDSQIQHGRQRIFSFSCCYLSTSQPPPPPLPSYLPNSTTLTQLPRSARGRTRAVFNKPAGYSNTSMNTRLTSHSSSHSMCCLPQPSRDRIQDITLATFSLLRTNHLPCPCSLQHKRFAPLGLQPPVFPRVSIKDIHVEKDTPSLLVHVSDSILIPPSCKPNCKHVQ